MSALAAPATAPDTISEHPSPADKAPRDQAPRDQASRDQASSRPALTAVRQRPARAAGAQVSHRRGAFAVTITIVLAAGLGLLLMLHTWAAQDGFKLASLQSQQLHLGTKAQLLAERDQQLQSPARLRQAATQLGMVPTGAPTFGKLHGGRTVSKATAEVAPPAAAPVSTVTRANQAKHAAQTVRARQQARQSARSSASSTNSATSHSPSTKAKLPAAPSKSSAGQGRATASHRTAALAAPPPAGGPAGPSHH